MYYRVQWAHTGKEAMIVWCSVAYRMIHRFDDWTMIVETREKPKSFIEQILSSDSVVVSALAWWDKTPVDMPEWNEVA